MAPRRPHLDRRAGRGLRLAGGLTLAGSLLLGCSAVKDTSSTATSSGSNSFGTPASSSAVKKGGTLTVALSAEPDQLDPTLSRSLYSRYVFETMCEKLYDVDAKTAIVPQLASALPKVSADGLTVTIPLRTGVKFADGTAFDSAAVKQTLERDLTLPTSARKSELGPITSVDTPDANSVVLHLSQPFSPLTAALTDRAGMVMSPTALTKLGDNFSTAPVCVGPFKFVNRVAQNSIDVERDPNYYDAGKVHLDHITYRIITDANIRAANLRSGDAQVADTLSTQDVPALRTTKGLSVLQSNSLGYQGLTVNVGNVAGLGKPTGSINTPLATDPRVRQAFSEAVDRDALVKTVFGGLYGSACGPISPDSQFASDASQACPKADPAAAKKLLAAAGVQVPYPVTMSISNNPDSLRLAQAMQAMVADGGFKLTIQPVEFSSLLDQEDAGKFETIQLGWSGRVDPDANITNFVGTGGSQNVGGYSNPALDTLLAQARGATDAKQRASLYGKAAQLMAKDNPIIYLYRQRNLTGVSDTVKGVQVFPDGVIRVAFAGLAK
jgi:peptide/nickel transport system substrate-binding protein